MTYYFKWLNEENKQIAQFADNPKAADLFGLIESTEQKPEQGHDGILYAAGHAPEIPDDILAMQKRAERDQSLLDTDKYMISDFPISAEEKEQYKNYRQYLRDLPESADFPHVDVLTFEEWKATQVSDQVTEV